MASTATNVAEFATNALRVVSQFPSIYKRNSQKTVAKYLVRHDDSPLQKPLQRSFR